MPSLVQRGQGLARGEGGFGEMGKMELENFSQCLNSCLFSSLGNKRVLDGACTS